MADGERVTGTLVQNLRQELTRGALPGETEGFTAEEQQSAAAFLAEAALERRPGNEVIRLESRGGADAMNRRMRLAIVNDDMPFLVDSVANAIAGRHLAIHRLLHPVVCVTRDQQGRLQNVEELCEDANRRESMMYIELDRADARTRQELVQELHAVLQDVRFAVADWRDLQARLRKDAGAVTDEEGRALLHWFADGALTLLGYHVERPGEVASDGLGIFRIPGPPTDSGGCRGAMRYFEQGGSVPLLAKAERKSTVHRRVPMDLIVVPEREGDAVVGIGVYAGLWTSEAMVHPAEQVPVLRRRLAELDAEFDFDPRGHSGKALRHAVSSLPRDLLINLSSESVRELVVTAMSLADRPRPAIALVRSILKGHLFAFVWLPRDDLSTRRRLQIGAMLQGAIGRDITSYAIELGEGDLALIRYTLYSDPEAPLPNIAELNERLHLMVRGWQPSVVEALAEKIGVPRATRLGFTYPEEAFPQGFQASTPPADAAEDILRLSRLAPDSDRDVRLCQRVTGTSCELHLRVYASGSLIPLSEAVPVLENFGFRVLEEIPTELGHGELGYIHDFRLELPTGTDVGAILDRAETVERAISDVLDGVAENDEFNMLVLLAGLDPQPVVWLRAWFRYLRQTGVAYGLLTIVEALRRSPDATRALVTLFQAAHDPSITGDRQQAVGQIRRSFDEALSSVKAIDDDRILRLFRSVVEATLRTNAFARKDDEALAFKLDPSKIPGLPAPIPYREIWVYSPQVEGIHLRGGPVARGGLRWSDRRDDFRTEILGLMKAQLVKNAVIVPTGAKGGFYPKQLPPPSDREAWLAEGTESYRVFIRSLLSVTDNIVEDQVVHPERVVIHDGQDPYFVVAADKGTATFSDVANAIALERGFWLGDAFASGGSNGYDHKAMGITAKGAWISVQRHFKEMGTDVQTQPIRVVGCGDMSGDVFGNGMLLSQAIKLVAAFDHRHIFIDPDPEPSASWSERKRLFDLPRSSWDDYDRKLLSRGGMIVPRTQKEIELTPEAQAALGLSEAAIDPTSLISAILKAPVDLIWFGGIGTYVKASTQANSAVGDPTNDMLRVDAKDLRAKVLGEGANLAITQAARIEFSTLGGRCNTDFIDNSAGVDCSDNEVNIKIPLNREMREGRLTLEDRNDLLVRMTDEVSELVLDDNRLQTLALSIAEHGGAAAVPAQVRTLELLEATGRLDRKVEGLETSDILLRRVSDNRGLTRPELSVLLSMSKLALQDAAEKLHLADEPLLHEQLLNAFPKPMQEAHREAILAHRLRDEILATKIANRFVNRLGPSLAMDMTEEEGSSLGQVVVAFLAAERLLQLDVLWQRIDRFEGSEAARLELYAAAGRSVRSHIGDILRAGGGETNLSKLIALLEPGLSKVNVAAKTIIREEVKIEAAARRGRLEALGASEEIVRGLVKLYELDGVFGITSLANRKQLDELAVTRAYVRLGEVLGLDWAQGQVARFRPTDQWERLLVAGLNRDFEQLRIDWMSRIRADDPEHAVERWTERHHDRIDQFRKLIARARVSGNATVPMLAQIANQARILLSR
ncbi:NAD-glutamate dehydrogenase [Sphingomonas arenae]|uniref:NAD-glutamate dehydrogenase n=1 Tax=Sphingomonas arenae TaxID=2812555 RepID=UPI0019675C58|nr:NAD-glutamate dehydrogenase domain-containing protein [Sphingomonas arenae]